MDTVGAFQAKNEFSKLLERVTHGEEITITRNGVPVARLVPVDAGERRNVKDVLKELREFSKGNTLGDLTVRELIDRGRRY